MKPFVFEINYTDPASVFETMHDHPYALFLDSSDQTHPDARYSFIMSGPAEVLTAHHTDTQNPFDQLSEKLAHHQKIYEPDSAIPYPFQGGAAGYFGYDLGRSLEHLPMPTNKSNALPDMVIGIYDHIIAFDHHAKTAARIIHAKSEDEAHNKITQRAALTPHKNAPLKWHAQQSAKDVERAVQKTIDYIYDGDIFQANIAQQFRADKPKYFCSWTYYKTLRAINPAPFGAYMNTGKGALLSMSPERFLSAHGTHITTRPIKGTLPKDQAPTILINSQKDRAENIMIVDLLRNDLSKTCTIDSVTVTDLCKLETFSAVHHLVSTVTGTLTDRHTAIDTLKTCFPGGSITGAPKIRAMEIIDQLEPFARGPYCGAMGYIGFNGNLDTNILIRTIIDDGQTLTLNAGSGITANSNPAAEVQEMMDKASIILKY